MPSTWRASAAAGHRGLSSKPGRSRTSPPPSSSSGRRAPAAAIAVVATTCTCAMACGSRCGHGRSRGSGRGGGSTRWSTSRWRPGDSAGRPGHPQLGPVPISVGVRAIAACRGGWGGLGPAAGLVVRPEGGGDEPVDGQQVGDVGRRRSRTRWSKPSVVSCPWSMSRRIAARCRSTTSGRRRGPRAAFWAWTVDCWDVDDAPRPACASRMATMSGRTRPSYSWRRPRSSRRRRVAGPVRWRARKAAAERAGRPRPRDHRA